MSEHTQAHEKGIVHVSQKKHTERQKAGCWKTFEVRLFTEKQFRETIAILDSL